MTDIGAIVCKITGNSATRPARLISPEVRDLLVSHGYDPARFNRWRWPIGASESSYVELLVTGADLVALNAAALSTDGLSVEIGAAGDTFTVAGLRALPPIPLCVSALSVGMGSAGSASGVTGGLWALPLVDERYHARRRPASANYNVSGAGRRFTQLDTPDDADDIIAGLATAAGLSITITDASTFVLPDVFAKGESAAVWLDRVAGATGRVIVRNPLGGFSCENIDKRTAATALSGFSSFLVAGGVRWQGAAGSGYVSRVNAGDGWYRDEVPAAVRVYFRSTAATDAPSYYEVDATTTASGEGLVDSHNYPRADLFDEATFDPLEAGDVTAAASRANEIATAFYRRWKAQSCSAILAGAQRPVMGGSIQVLTWILDPIAGIRTLAESSTSCPVYAHKAPRFSDVYASHGVEMARDAAGVVRVSGGGGSAGIFIRGTITAVGGSDDGDGNTPVGDLTYDVDTETGGTITAGIPEDRPGDGTGLKFTRPSVGSLAIVRVDPSDGEVLYRVPDERIPFETCPTE